jgi:hypothetical protein
MPSILSRTKVTALIKGFETKGIQSKTNIVTQPKTSWTKSQLDRVKGILIFIIDHPQAKHQLRH